MASRRSLFNRNGLVTDHSNRNGLVADQSLTDMARRSEFNSNCNPEDHYFSEGLTHQSIALYVGWLTNRQLTGAPHR